MTPLLLFTLSFLITEIKCARILGMFPTPSISHQVVFRPIYQELVKRGHEVVVITTDPMFKDNEAPQNLTEIDVHDISYSLWKKHWLSLSVGKNTDIVTQTGVYLEVTSKLFEGQTQTQEFQEIMRDKNMKFDLILLESPVLQTVSLTHVFKAPAVLISSLGVVLNNNDVFGAANHPFLYPTPVTPKFLNLNVLDRISELYRVLKMKYLINTFIQNEHKTLQRIFGHDIPRIPELNNNVQLLLLNNHPLWSSNRPVPPSVVYIGGIHLKPKQDLPHDLENYLNSSKHGVIYFSFGTNTNLELLPKEKVKMFVKVFSELPYDVLWKWDSDVLPGQTKNIKISKWLPQADLLKHPKIKLFITQGGLQSTDEAIAAAVPLVGIPLLGDQWFNVEKYVQHQIGVKLIYDTLSEEEFKSAITTVIEDSRYRRNIEKLREVTLDQPQGPLERAVWWIEHVLRHGGSHLRSPSANMSLAEFYELDLVLIILSSCLVVICLFCYILLGLWRFVSRQTSTARKLKHQ